MSVEAITWALKQPIEHSSTKFVLVVVANCADGQYFLAWPSMKYISDATGQNRKTVLSNIKKLRDLGYLVDTGERKGETCQIIVYRLNSPENGTASTDETVPKTGQLQQMKQSQKRTETVPKTDGNSPKNGTRNRQNRQGTVNIMSGSQKANADAEMLGNTKSYKNTAIELLNFLNAKTNRHYRATDVTFKPIIARLREGYTIQECKAVVVRKCREWGGDDKMRQYLRPETLFGCTKFAQYVGEVPPPDAVSESESHPQQETANAYNG